jgi:aspartate aminotransferase/aminotransferase
LLLPDPYFLMYEAMAAFYGARPVLIDTYPDFRLTAERVEKALTPKSKVLAIISPSNPTCMMAAENELKAIAEIARKHELLVVSDEIYDIFSYDRPTVSISKFYDRTLVMGGFSKSLGMPGWRMGWAAGPADVIGEMIKLQQYTFVCAPSFAQRAVLRYQEHDTRPYTAAYKKKRDLIYEGIRDKYEVVKPEGAFYVFPKAPRGLTGSAFIEEAIKNNVLLVPGKVFSRRDTHFRLSYAASEATLERGIEILRRLA